MSRFISWNVNGLRAILKKGFEDIVIDMEPDILAIQETKMQAGQATVDLPGYHEYWSHAERKGYSGTAVFTKSEPLRVWHGFDFGEVDDEGRITGLEFDDNYFVCCYSPNSQDQLKRIGYRLAFEDRLREMMTRLDKDKPMILCGDLNVAHEEIDLKNPGPNRGNAGFSDEERDAFSRLLDAGFTDTFRHLHPDQTGAYSWWSYRFNARKNNAGWRIDYFVVSNRIAPRISDAFILDDVFGSDHCPVGIEFE